MEFPSKFQFSKNCLKLWRITSFVPGTNNLQKNIFLALFKMAQNFHYFCKVRALEFPSKIQFYKNYLKLWRNTSFDEGNK